MKGLLLSLQTRLGRVPVPSPTQGLDWFYVPMPLERQTVVPCASQVR